MASAFSHAVAALSIGTCFYRPQVPKQVWVAGIRRLPEMYFRPLRSGCDTNDPRGTRRMPETGAHGLQERGTSTEVTCSSLPSLSELS